MACKTPRRMRRPGADWHRPEVTCGTALHELPHQGKGGQVFHREGDHDVASVRDRRTGGSAASRPACRGQPSAAGRPHSASGSRRSKARLVHDRGMDLCPPGPCDCRPRRLRTRQLREFDAARGLRRVRALCPMPHPRRPTPGSRPPATTARPARSRLGRSQRRRHRSPSLAATGGTTSRRDSGSPRATGWSWTPRAGRPDLRLQRRRCLGSVGAGRRHPEGRRHGGPAPCRADLAVAQGREQGGRPTRARASGRGPGSASRAGYPVAAAGDDRHRVWPVRAGRARPPTTSGRPRPPMLEAEFVTQGESRKWPQLGHGRAISSGQQWSRAVCSGQPRSMRGG
jgi:hypothetical protein